MNHKYGYEYARAYRAYGFTIEQAPFLFANNMFKLKYGHIA